MNPFGRIRRAWLDFLMEYTIVPGPPGGYYIDSPDMWGISCDSVTEQMRFVEGALHYNYPFIGLRVNPAYVAWYGLILINAWMKTKDREFLNRAVAQGRWLRDNAVPWNDAVRWEYRFDFADGDTVLKAPWPSAMAQGLGISLLARLHAITGDDGYRELASHAVRLYEISIEDGGVAARLNGSLYFEEYPAYPLTLVLDGTLFSLLGLYDVSGEDRLAKRLFEEGIGTIERNWQVWDWRGRWSRYGSTGFFSSLSYHRLNCALVKIFQEKGYLKSFPLEGWVDGVRLKKLVAFYQIGTIAAKHLKRHFRKCAG